MNKITAVKIGGSFFNDNTVKKLKNITSIIEQLSSRKSQENFLLITGGGRAADLVREFDSAVALNNKSAHFAAVAAMELNAYLLSDFFEEFSFCSADDFLAKDNYLENKNSAKNINSFENINSSNMKHILDKKSFLSKQINIFLPLDYYRKLDPLPHSWQVSSDSIALEIALRAGAERLVLLKQRGYSSQEKENFLKKHIESAKRGNQNINYLRRISAKRLSNDGLIDEFFPELFRERIKSSKNNLDCIIADANYLSEFEKYLIFKDEERGRLSLSNLIKII